MKPPYHIHICEELRPLYQGDLFYTLECLLPVRFICIEASEVEINGNIMVNGRAEDETAAKFYHSPSLTVAPPNDPGAKGRYIEFEVKFSDDSDVPFPFRGRKVNIKLEVQRPVLTLSADEKVLASNECGPIWSVSQIGGVKHFRSALRLPQMSSEQNFSDIFNGERFLESLVLLQYIREITATTAYRNPSLRASFIIDDPNLHWPRYGFVDYRDIAAHAKKENYHVAFATIPLDTWFTHSATADIFRTNSRWLSLLIHGNNHAKEELAKGYSEVSRKALLVQAIRRIERLERKANLHVSRVMVPPHGACSEEMLADLPKYGFESACISAGSLRYHNPSKPWTRTLGFFPSEVIENCLVLPRWGLNGNVRNSLLVAAYLGQPLVLRGHHQDMKDGVEILGEYAKFINGFGDVFWSNMTDLSRRNYLWRMDGKTCHMVPLGANVQFELPSEATEIIVETFGNMECNDWQVVSTDGSIFTPAPCKPFLLEGGNRREILFAQTALPQVVLEVKRTSARLILRRLLTEARDRFLVLGEGLGGGH